MQRRYVSWMLTMSLLGGHGHEARAQDAAAPIPSAALATALEIRNTMTLRQRALEKWVAGDADPALGLLAEAIARFPYDASNYVARSRILSELKRYDAAIADLRRATELEPALSNAWGNLGWHLILQGDFAAAQAASRRAADLEPDNFAWNLNLGHAYLLQGDRETAHGWYEKTIPLIPDESRLKTGALADFDLFIGQGWQVEACRTERVWFEAAARHALLENHWTREQHRLSDEAWTQGTALRQAERFLEAAEAYRRSAEVEQASGRPRMQDLTAKLSLAALMYQRIARYGEAEPLFREALAIQRQALHEGNPAIATSLNSLAELLLATGRYGEAEPLLREALGIRRQVLLEGHPDIALALNNLALLLDTTGRYDEAEPLYRKALAIRQQALPAGHHAIAGSLNNLAELLKTTGRPAEAEPLYQQALQIAQSLQVPELLWTVQGNLADFYAKHSQRPRAILFGKQAVNTLQAVRQNLAGTEQAIQQSFLKNKECYYKHLADWLIAEGCLREAQQVLEMLKAQEHFEFIRGDLCHTQSTQDRSDSTGEVCHAGA